MKPITQAAESFQLKYPQVASLRISEATGEIITGVLTGKLQHRSHPTVPGGFKTYAEVKVGTTYRYLRFGGSSMLRLESAVGIKNLAGYAVSGKVKSFNGDDGKPVQYVDELIPSQELVAAVKTFLNPLKAEEKEKENEAAPIIDLDF